MSSTKDVKDAQRNTQDGDNTTSVSYKVILRSSTSIVHRTALRIRPPAPSIMLIIDRRCMVLHPLPYSDVLNGHEMTILLSPR